MIEFVFLDLDDTLLDFHRAETEAIRDTFLSFSLPADDEAIARYKAINRRTWEAMERGELTRDEVLTRRFDVLFDELSVSISSKEVQAFYERRLSVGHYFMPGATELLDELYGKYKLYIATNGTPVVQEGRMKSAGIGKYFDEIFISAKIGKNKPDPGFFDYAFERIPNFSKSRAIIVGDSLTSDILGGINAGIKTCLYNPKGQAHGTDVAADYEIKELSELPGLLAEI